MQKDELIGKMAFGCRLEEFVGKGGFGRVYRAVHPDAGRVYAVKVFSAALEEDEKFMARFKSEVKTLGNLQHPNIVGFFTAGMESVGPAIMMEYMDGTNLEKRVVEDNKVSPLAINLAAKITIELLSALGYAHDKGIVHSDVHPGNLLLEKSGAVKLTDFGLARMVHGDLGVRSPYSSSGLSPRGIRGFGEYAPPELRNGAPLTPQSDIYQAGLVFSYMLGKEPLDQKPLQEINPRVAGGLKAIIDRSLEKEPANRYRSAAEFAEAIRAYLNPAQFTEYPERIRQLLGDKTDVLTAQAIAEMWQKLNELKRIDAERGLRFDYTMLSTGILIRKHADTQRITAYVAGVKGRPRPIPEPEKPGIVAQLTLYKAAVRAWEIENADMAKTW